MNFGIPPWAIGVGVIVVIMGIVHAVSARLLPPGYRRRSMKEMMRGDMSAELEELQARLGELDELKHRVGELEERVDFAERLLAQKREAERLQP